MYQLIPVQLTSCVIQVGLLYTVFPSSLSLSYLEFFPPFFLFLFLSFFAGSLFMPKKPKGGTETSLLEEDKDDEDDVCNKMYDNTR